MSFATKRIDQAAQLLAGVLAHLRALGLALAHVLHGDWGAQVQRLRVLADGVGFGCGEDTERWARWPLATAWPGPRGAIQSTWATRAPKNPRAGGGVSRYGPACTRVRCLPRSTVGTEPQTPPMSRASGQLRDGEMQKARDLQLHHASCSNSLEATISCFSCFYINTYIIYYLR